MHVLLKCVWQARMRDARRSHTEGITSGPAVDLCRKHQRSQRVFDETSSLVRSPFSLRSALRTARNGLNHIREAHGPPPLRVVIGRPIRQVCAIRIPRFDKVQHVLLNASR